MIEGQNESKVKKFCAVATSRKMMFYFAPPSPMLKAAGAFQVTATKCHLSLSRCCHFGAVPLVLALNRGFVLTRLSFHPQPLREMEHSLLLSRDFAPGCCKAKRPHPHGWQSKQEPTMLQAGTQGRESP